MPPLAVEPEPEPPAANEAEAARLRPATDEAAGPRAAGPGAAPDGAAPDGAAPDGAAPDGALRLARLSRRECELVTLVAQGRTDAQIAAQLYITVRTVSSTGPGPGQDRLPAPRRPHPARPERRPGRPSPVICPARNLDG